MDAEAARVGTDGYTDRQTHTTTTVTLAHARRGLISVCVYSDISCGQMHAHVVLYWEGQFGCFRAQRLAVLDVVFDQYS